jgi:hypothetical protein
MTLMKSSWVSREKNVEDDIIENDKWKKTWQNTRDRIQSVWFDEYNRIESNRIETVLFNLLMILKLSAASTQIIEYN